MPLRRRAMRQPGSTLPATQCSPAHVHPHVAAGRALSLVCLASNMMGTIHHEARQGFGVAVAMPTPSLVNVSG